MDTLIAWNNRNYDSEFVRTGLGMYSTSGLTCRVAGIYLLELSVVMAAAGGVRNVRLLLNGTSVGSHTLVPSQAYSGGTEHMQVAATMKLAVGDIVRGMVWQNSGGSVSLYGPTSAPNWFSKMSATYVGPTTA